MSPHVEWMNADCAIRMVAPGDFEDSYGTKNDQPALVLGFDDFMVIEGTKEQLLVMLARATQLVATADLTPRLSVGRIVDFTYPDYGHPDGYPRLTAHSGQTCMIVRELGDDERDPEVGRMFIVRFADGVEGTANEDELS